MYNFIFESKIKVEQISSSSNIFSPNYMGFYLLSVRVECDARNEKESPLFIAFFFAVSLIQHNAFCCHI